MVDDQDVPGHRGLTKQGVRNLNDPQRNSRKVTKVETCFHEWEHERECVGCWAEQFGGYEHADHHEVCRRCGDTRLIR